MTKRQLYDWNFAEGIVPRSAKPPVRFSLARLLVFMIVLSLLLALNTWSDPIAQPYLAVGAVLLSAVILVDHPDRLDRMSTTGKIACGHLLITGFLAVLSGEHFPVVLAVAAFPACVCPILPEVFVIRCPPSPNPMLSISVVLSVPVNAYLWGYYIRLLLRGGKAVSDEQQTKNPSQ